MLAHKDTLSYRAGKFIRRNKLGVAAAIIVLVRLVGGIIATAWPAALGYMERGIQEYRKLPGEPRFEMGAALYNLATTVT